MWVTALSLLSLRPIAESISVFYTVNKKPVLCENPFRKVFTRRKQFYQSKESPAQSQSSETSSNKLIWRHDNHRCAGHSTPSHTQTPNYFTLNANIQPFDPFVIKHDLSGLHQSSEAGTDLGGCSSANLSVTGHWNNESDSAQTPVQVLPDGTGLKYVTKVEEDGKEASLEVSVQRDGSTITTRRTGAKECTSNEISVKLVEGSSTVNIQQVQVCTPTQKPVRPSSLNIPGPKYATARNSQSVRAGTSPVTSPRYNSLPNLKGPMYEAYSRDPRWGYQSHPKDEERKLAFTRALLGHQMEQLFKLEKELRTEKSEMVVVKCELQDLENQLKQQAFSLQSQTSTVQTQEVNKLEQDISSLRGSVDTMVRKVTHLTGGKVPLGEDSIKDYKPYLSQEPSVPDTSDCDRVTVSCGLPPQARTQIEEDKWECSECTFANHPSLDTCEMCEMPRITLGSHHTGTCFCHPSLPSHPLHKDQGSTGCKEGRLALDIGDS